MRVAMQPRMTTTTTATTTTTTTTTMTRASFLLAMLVLATTASATAMGCGGDGDSDPLPYSDDIKSLPDRHASADGGPEGGSSGGFRDGGVATSAVDAASDPFADVPVASLPDVPACPIETRAVYIEGSRKIESITARGTYWSREVFSNGTVENADGFPTPVATEPKFVNANGPCAGKGTACAFDARAIYFDGASRKVETIAAFGKLYAWTFDASYNPISLPGYPQAMTANALVRSGPCPTDSCHIDTRAVWRADGQVHESFTANGRIWSYTLGEGGARAIAQPLATYGMTLTSIPRYLTGPCISLAPNAQCSFDTRTLYPLANGHIAEEITARGRLWTFELDANDAVIAAPIQGTPLVSIPSFQEICGL